MLAAQEQSITKGAPNASGSVGELLARNRTWFERARELGATRYPIGALEFTGRVAGLHLDEASGAAGVKGRGGARSVAGGSGA